MTIWYSARNIFNQTIDGWEKYIDFSGLTQAEEIVSLDCSLNDPVFNFDPLNENDRENAVFIPDKYLSPNFYSNLDFVLFKINEQMEYNLLAVIFQPTSSCDNLILENFTFIGYDLLDQSHDTSALTNCGGAPDIFENTELNKYGLLNYFERAVEIQNKLFTSEPGEYHSDTNLWAIWRHNSFGRK